VFLRIIKIITYLVWCRDILCFGRYGPFIFITIEMVIYKVKKRNGTIVSFDRKKIEKAIENSIVSVWGDDFSQVSTLVDQIIARVAQMAGKNAPDVEDIQDVVEEILIKNGHNSVAKSYILYRNKRSQSRKEKKVMIDVAGTMEEYLGNVDRRIKENANIGYSIWGLILKNSEKITANYWLSHIYPEEVGNAHRNGDFHIHDLGLFTWYCAGRSLRVLLEEGFNGVPEKVESDPPKNLQSAVNQMVNFLGVLQNERAGAQAFSSVDTYLAPFVHKYRKEEEQRLIETHAQFSSEEERETYLQKRVYKYVLQNIQNLIFGLNTPSRWGTQTPFSNFTLDRVCPEDLKEKALILGGKTPYEKKFWELQEEMKIVNKALMEVYTAGDSKGRVFTFPIPTYNITEDFDRDDPLTDELFEMTAKYGLPYFQNFVWSQYIRNEDGELKKDPKAYSPGAVRSMCCRLQLDLRELEKRWGGLFGSAEMTGSIGVVTLNMARVWYTNKGDRESYKKQVKYLMDLAKTSLELKRKELKKWLDNGFYPYTKRYLGTYRNHFSTIGVNGINESIVNFTEGKEDISTEWGRDFAEEILEYIRNILKEYQEETGNLYNLEATPAEGTTYRFAREDQKQHYDIIQAGTKEAPYYTNSSQIPVGHTDDPFEALDLQDKLQTMYTGGTVLHLYLGERLPDVEACKAFVKKAISNYRLPYITVTPTFSICPKHGYIAGEHDFCPICDAEIGYTGQKFDIETRKRYTQYEEKMEAVENERV